MLFVSWSSSASSSWTIVYVPHQQDRFGTFVLILTQTAMCWNVISGLLRNRTRYACRPPSGLFHTALNGA